MCRGNSVVFAEYDARDQEVYSNFLTKGEYAYLSNMSEMKQKDSLIGRVVAKYAVIAYIKETFDTILIPRNIDIQSNGEQPTCTFCENTQKIIPPHLSIAHSDGRAVAFAVHAKGTLGVGVDIERVRPWREETVRGFLVDKEYVRCVERKESFYFYVTLFWCLKEAYVKALGTGLRMHPRDIVIDIDDANDHKITLKIKDKIIGAQVDWTQKEGSYIITTIIL